MLNTSRNRISRVEALTTSCFSTNIAATEHESTSSGLLGSKGALGSRKESPMSCLETQMTAGLGGAQRQQIVPRTPSDTWVRRST